MSFSTCEVLGSTPNTTEKSFAQLVYYTESHSQGMEHGKRFGFFSSLTKKQIFTQQAEVVES